jgi:thymidylate synthase ThyX
MPLPVLTAAPDVRLRNASIHPYDSAIAAARTCYSPRVVDADEVTAAQRAAIGPLTFDAGHHTVWQHAHFEFALENVSRQFVWTFLHSHPFYNSEQSSQRFVRLDEARAFVPASLAPEARAVYEMALTSAWDAYRLLSETLLPETHRLVAELRHVGPRAGEKRTKRVAREAGKKAIEIARYVIPVAAFTSMVHTVSGLVLHRLLRMMRSGDAPAETTSIVTRMVALARAHDEDFFERIGAGALEAGEIVEQTLPRLAPRGDEEAQRLDALLGNRSSLLVDFAARGEQTVAEAVRTVLGAPARALSDDNALELVLDPAHNRQRIDTLALAVHSPLGRTLHHPTYTFLKKLSHSADSQDQRHRMVPASRPLMTFTDTAQPDYVVPSLVARIPLAREIFEEQMAKSWAVKNRLLEMGVPLADALYVLPNAKALRFHETGSLLFLSQKWVQRTCFNAQEEIFRASMDEIEQVRAVHPRLARHLGPPCVLRAGLVSPVCTEGEHFCGVPVWRSFPDAKRIL